MSKTLLIEENLFFREGLRLHLSDIGFEVIAAFESLSVFDPNVLCQCPDLVIVGPGSIEVGADELMVLRAALPVTHKFRSVRLLDFADVAAVGRFDHEGYDAVLSKEVTGDVLARSLQLVVLGQQIFPSFTRERRSASPIVAFPVATRAWPDVRPPVPAERDLLRASSLSAREIETVGQLVSGASNKQIAQQLRISEATVKARLKSLLRKIGVINRTQIALWAMDNPELWRTAAMARPGSRTDGQLGVIEMPNFPHH